MSNVLKPPSLIKPQPSIMPLRPQAVTAQQPVDEEEKPEWRKFTDPIKTRGLIYDNVLKAAQNVPPLENSRHILRLKDVNYADKGEFDYQQQKQAILGNQTLGRRLAGTWELLDKVTGQPIDTRKATIARVPFMTERGTFINNGVEYTVANQLRLRPGIFTRVKDNGEIEAHANFIPGKGVGHRYYLDPAKGVFYLRMEQAKIPIMPLLRALGARDSDLKAAWGDQLYASNIQQEKVSDINKLYDKLIGNRGTAVGTDDRAKAIAETIQKFEMDPEVTGRTLGKNHKNLSLEAVLDTTRKLLAVSRGEQEVDDRDHLAFQTIVGPEDLFAERITKDAGRLRNNLFYKSSFKGNLKPFNPGVLTKQIESVIMSSGLGQSLEEINTAEIMDKLTRITKLGEGGVGSIDAIPDESRSVQPSHFGYIDAVRTPESLRAGVDVYLSASARKGNDGRIYIPLLDAKTGKKVYRSPQDLADRTVAFPGEMNRKSKRIGAMQGGKLGFFSRDNVDFILPNFESAFSPLAQFVPLKSAMKAQRMSMGSRMSTQALSLTSPEAPYVQTGIPGETDKSYEELYGTQMGAVRADKPGKVIAVSPTGVQMKYDDGTTGTVQTYSHFPFNRKSYLHNTPLVKAGDRVEAGGLLAKSNYTDDKGVSAIGLNARVGYLPYKGHNFEDAIVISESFAKRLASEHMYQTAVERGESLKFGKRPYVALFPGKYDKATLERLDDDGVIKPGTEVNYGDPLVLSAKQRSDSHSKVHKRKQAAFNDASETWEHHSPGIVTDVHKSDKGITVLVKAKVPMQVGDKMSGRYGDKGVISHIETDDKMPRGEDGQPLEVLVNDLGIISRTNPNQIVEAVLGKIAAKTGKHYKVQDFESIDDLIDFAEKEAKKHGIKDLETVTDPETGRGINDILVGNRFFMKLSHTAEDKLQGRSTGGYTMDDTPARGGASGSKRLSLLDTNALLSHGATGVLRDARTIRGQRNEDYWLAFMEGKTPPKPKVPLSYQKFINQLRGSGINVVEDGTQTHIMALTNKDVDELAGDREIKSGETVRFDKGLEPVKGGLFDVTLTGGHSGNRWSYIKLKEPMLNPVMEEPARRLLGLTKDKFEAVLAGREQIGQKTGPQAIQDALKGINLDKEIESARQAIASNRKTKRDEAVRKIGYLKNAKRLGIHPGDWVLDKVPVLPPRFRPVATMSDKNLPLVADANMLYKELLDANSNLGEMKGLVDDTGDERLAVYNSLRAVVGLGDPVHPKLQEKRVRGLLQHIFGHSPKTGTLQRRLISSTVDLVGRGVITPNPDLDMDTVGLPAERAWDVYKQFVVRRLKQRGMGLLDALRHVKDRSELAKKELLTEMEHRPIIINRAPVLHRFGIMAFYPRLAHGNTLQISPLVVKGFGADFDGDAMQFHVPVDEDARLDAIEKMLPSRNLLSPADFESPVHQPSNEYISGLYKLTAAKSNGRKHTFRNTKDIIAAYRRGDIDLDTVVERLT